MLEISLFTIKQNEHVNIAVTTCIATGLRAIEDSLCSRSYPMNGLADLLYYLWTFYC